MSGVGVRAAALIGAWLACAAQASAHSASDAYLDLTVLPEAGRSGEHLKGQWDVALRDLDFVLTLDDDGDGRLTWQEVRRHRAAIVDYVLAHLHIAGGPGNVCTVKAGPPMIDAHADGAYASVFFDVSCTRATRRLTVDYGLFFAIDPSHRAIVVLHDGDDTSTALLAPDNATIDWQL